MGNEDPLTSNLSCAPQGEFPKATRLLGLPKLGSGITLRWASNFLASGDRMYLFSHPLQRIEWVGSLLAVFVSAFPITSVHLALSRYKRLSPQLRSYSTL